MYKPIPGHASLFSPWHLRLQDHGTRFVADGSSFLRQHAFTTVPLDAMDEPVIPMATPRRDDLGRITYVGEDGRRYAVEPSPLVSGALDGADSGGTIDTDVFRQMEDLARRWLRSSLPPNLRHEDAVALLLASLERSLRKPDGPATPG